MMAGPAPLSISTGFFKSVVFGDPNWDFRTFDVDRDTKLADERDGALLNSNDPNLEPFKKHGGKLLIYESWDEAIIPPRSMIDYYDSVLKAMGGKKETYDFVRLFMVPGMGMCPGFGFGDNGTFNALDVVEKWRETGKAPDEIINTHTVGETVDRDPPGVPVSAGGRLQGERRSDDAA